MVTKRYADILDEDRQILAAEMEKKFTRPPSTRGQQSCQ